MRVAIVGLGLIGGSLGLALRREGVEVVGYARRREVGQTALSLGAVDRATDGLLTAVEGAEVVFLATPVMAMRPVMAALASGLDEGCIVTDVGSTKAQVLAWAGELLPPSVSFVGGHPMAGTELSGIEAADADLFQGCTYCIAPAAGAATSAADTIEGLARRVGASPLYIDAAEHDGLVAAISHLPMVMSSALVSMAMSSPQWPDMAKLAATGFGGATRLASGSPEMSRDICLTNADPILRWLDEYVAELGRFRRLIGEGGEGLLEAFVKARELRDNWLRTAQRGSSPHGQEC